MQPASRTLPSSRQHHRNRSLSDSQPGAAATVVRTTGNGDRTIQPDLGSTASLFVPSRQAPKPPPAYLQAPERPSTSNSSPQPSRSQYSAQVGGASLPTIIPQRVKRKPLGPLDNNDNARSLSATTTTPHTFQNDTHNNNNNNNNSNIYPSTYEHPRSPGSFASNKIDDVSIKKSHHHQPKGGAKKSIGKLFKRLGSRTFDDEHVGFDDHSRSTSSTSSSTGSFDDHHYRPTSPRHPTHNVPLAPPAPPPPQIPLIEIGKRTYLQPGLEIGLQETDDLLSQIPIELRTRPMSPQNFHTRPTISESLDNKRKPNERSDNTNDVAAFLPNLPAPSSTYMNFSSIVPSSSQQQQQQQQQHQRQQTSLPPRGILNNKEESSSRNATRVQQQHTMVATASSADVTEDADKDGQNNLSVSRYDLSDDDTTNETYPCSRWSNASTGKSSGTYSLYSTFGTESRPGSGSGFDLVEAESSFNSQDLKQKLSVYLSGESLTIKDNKKTIMARQEDNNGDDGDETQQQSEKGQLEAQEQEKQDEEKPIDLSQIVANNVKRRVAARVVSNDDDNGAAVDDSDPKIPGAFPVDDLSSSRPAGSPRDDDEKQDDSNSSDDSSSDDDDIFVDATGLSQEEIEREKADRRLSKRLSGGHFGSAGGLLLSIGAPPVPSVPESHRNSRSSAANRRSIVPPPLPDDDVAQAMLNWKRQSSGLMLKRASQRSRSDSATASSTAAQELADLLSLENAKRQPEQELPALTDAEKSEQREKTQANLSGITPTPSSSSSSKQQQSPSSPPPAAATSRSQEQQQEQEPREQTEEQQQQQQSLPPPPRPPARRKRSFPLEQMPNATAADYATKELPKPPEIRLQGDATAAAESRPRFSEDARMAAKRLWEEDESFVPRERIAEWLGQRKPLNSETLVCYMSYFQFSHMRLDNAFRKLCSKLYFKAEAQQIDRLLEVFAQRYWDCNPNSLFGDADVVYAVVYSLLLLNTDLHVAQGNHARMNRQAFVKNTMSTIRDQKEQSNLENNNDGRSRVFSKAWEMEMESYLKDLYYSVKQYQILQPLANQQQQQLAPGNTQTLEKRSSILGGRRVVEFKRSMMRMNGGRDSPMLSSQEEPTPRTSTSAGPSTPLGSPRRDSFSSSISITSYGSGGGAGNAARSNANTLSPHQPMMNFMQNHVSDLFASRPPYLKEGVVVRKHLLENGNQRARHREWKECFLVVSNGELKMYAMHGTVSEERRSVLRVSSVSNFATLADSLGGGSGGAGSSSTRSNGSVASIRNSPSFTSNAGSHQWTSSMQLLGSIALNHTLSNILPPPGYNRQRPHVFAIQQPNGGVYLFQTVSQEQANEWVETCNYWAARQSKEPLPGGVSNMEYGWGDCLNDVILDLDSIEISGKYLGDPDAVTIYDWRPPAPPSVPSTLDEKEQLAALQKHLHALGEEINEHRELKRKILVKFHAKTQNHSKALANWESKSNYLLHEIIKYQNYCMALEKSAERRQRAQQQEQEAAENQASNKLLVVQENQQLEYKHTELDLFSEIGKELQHWNL